MAVKQAIALMIGFMIMIAMIGVSSNIKQSFACGSGGGSVAVTLYNGQTAYLTTQSGTITSSSSSPPPQQAPPNSLQAVYGLINYTIQLNQNVTSAVVQITYPSIPANSVMYKFINNQWVQIPTQNYQITGNVVTLTIQDNSSLDTNNTPGVISDPLALLAPPQQQPDFSFSLNPTSGSTNPGGNVTTTATITTQGNFTGTVNISLVNPPTGVTISPTSANVTQNGQQVQLTISTTSSTPIGTHNLTVRMVSGSLQRDQPFSLTVSQSMGNFSSTYSWSVKSGSGTLSSNTARNPSVTDSSEGITNVIGYQTVTPAAAAKTQIPSTYKIMFVGDIGSNPSVLQSKIQEENPNLLILLGDYIYGFTSTSEVDSWYNNLIPAGFSGKIISVPGNHDIYATYEGGTASPGRVDKNSTTQPTAAADLQLYLFDKLGMTPTGNIVFKDANVAVLGSPSAAFGPASGAVDSTDTTYSAITMTPIVSSLSRAFLDYWAPIIREDQSAEWKIFLSHYQLLGWNTGSAGRDRNDLRYYYLPQLIKQSTDSSSAESFDMILSGHFHGNGRSKVFLPNATAPMFAVPDSNFANANYDNNGSVDFTDKSHGIIQFVNGNGGRAGGNPNFDYSSYPLSAYANSPDFTGRVWTDTTWGYSTITITNTDTSTSAVIRSYNRDDATGTWSLSDTFTINKNRRFAGDMQNINVNTNASGTPFTPHSNIYDPYRRNGLAGFVPMSNNAAVNAISVEEVTISAWIYWFGTKDVNTWRGVGWKESTGVDTLSTDSNQTHQVILWGGGDPRSDSAWQNTVHQFGIVNTGTNAGKLGYLAEDNQGNNTSFDTTVSSATIPTNQWTHVAVKITDGGTTAADTIAFFINGSASGTATTSVGFRDTPGTSDPLLSPYYTTVGHDNANSRWFNGYIANVAVFTRALSDTEIQSLYNNPDNATVLSDPSLVYKFYFGSGTQTGALLNVTTTKDGANYFSLFAAAARWAKDVTGNAGSAVALDPSWLYADSGQYPLFIASVFTPLLREMADWARKISKIIPSVQKAYAQTQEQQMYAQACKMAEILPIIGVAVLIIASVSSLLSFRRDDSI